MASPPQDRTVTADDLRAADWPDRLSRIMDRFMGQSVRALSAGLTLGQNIRAQVHTATVTVPDDWVQLGTTPGFVNGWGNWSDGTFDLPAVRKAEDGTVYFRGLLLAPSVLPAFGSAIAYLPATYLPTQNQGPFACAAYSGGSDGFASLAVTNAANGGNLNYRMGGTGAQWLSLATVRYLADDRTPPVAACWPYDFAPDYPDRPQAVLLAEAHETTTDVLTRVAPPAWDWVAKAGGDPYVRIRNVAGLVPNKTYRLTFLVLW